MKMVKIRKVRETPGYEILVAGKLIEVGDVIEEPEDYAAGCLARGYELVDDGAGQAEPAFAYPEPPPPGDE